MRKPTGEAWRKLFGELLSDEPCPRCLELARAGRIRVETVQRLPVGAHAPVARDGSGKCCFDCASADGLLAHMGVGQYLEAQHAWLDRQNWFNIDAEEDP